MVTKEMLERLRSERSQLTPGMHLTPGGPVEAQVNRSVDTEREKTISQGERMLREARTNLYCQQNFSRHEGMAKSSFNHSSQGPKL